MSGQTTRFALNFFGAGTPGAFSDDGDKYTAEDRLTLDKVLAALEKHNHRVTTTLAPPTSAPTAIVSTTDTGALEGESTYYYRISFTNADGLETVAGPEVVVTTPDQLLEPDAPSGETSTVTGNTLSAGLYYYALSALRSGEESPLGDLTAVTVLTGENTVTLTLPALNDATSLQVWRMKSTDPGYTRIGTTTAGTFLDNGSVAAGLFGDPANIPATATDSDANYAIEVSLTGGDITAVTGATTWRIYRSDTAGVYSATSLVHEVVETVDQLDPDSGLVTTWLDDGDVQLTGSPKLFSTELNVPPFTFETADPLPSAAGYPANYPIVDGSGVLYIQRAGAWQPVSGSTGAACFSGTGDPSPEPTGAQAGDLYFNTVNGDVWVLDGV